MKTGTQIETDFYKAVKNTRLYRKVTGEIYKDGFRPRDSAKEDIVVRLTTVSGGQVQDGVITLLVFVPDIDASGSGDLKRDTARLTKLEDLGAKIVEELRCELPDYDNIKLQYGVQTYPDDKKEHFISIRLLFSFVNSEY